MATIRAFRALRPSTERAAEVSAVPYDVVSTAEARELAAGNPLSFLHVSRPEIDLPDGTDPYSDEVYAKAAESFETLRRDAPLTLEDIPSLYIYRLSQNGREQTGVATCCSVAEYDRNLVRKHEKTRRQKEDDRTRHIVTLRAQTGPVFLTYRDAGAIDESVSRVCRSEPLFEFTSKDGVGHTVWQTPPPETKRLVDAFSDIPLLYIADGHHRAASASRAHAQLEKSGRAGTSGFFLTVAFPAGQVEILPYNRIVRDLAGRSPEQLIAALEEKLEVREDAASSPAAAGTVSMYLAGKWFSLRLPAAAGGGVAATLDANRLEASVLEPFFGIEDVRTDKRIDFVGGIRGTEELERLVDDAHAAVAFSMFPVSLDDLMTVSDAEEIMPPKSTWFEPKLRDGLLSHVI